MKTILIIILIISTTMGATLFFHKPPKTTEISVLRDVTDKHLAQPNADEIIKLFDLTGLHKWNGAIFRFSNVSDITYSPVSETKVEPNYEWSSNEIERVKEIQTFNETISEIIGQSKNDSIGRDHSSVFLPIFHALQRLSESKSYRRVLIVYSDLLENNMDVSLYEGGMVNVAQLNKDSLGLIIQNEPLLPNLTGIEVYLIYQAADAEKDKEYRIISDFYKSLLENKGAKVVISGNLQI